MIISRENNVLFGLSKKKDGQMIVKEGNEGFFNRSKYFSGVGINVDNFVSAMAVHGNNVEVVSVTDKGKIIEGTDGLITQKKNICLAVTVSDCLPVFIYNKNTIGVVHAGWRGVVKNILLETIEKMNKACNCSLDSLNVFVGPHIKKCHFEIKDDILDNFTDYNEQVSIRDGKIFIDLGEIVKRQLLLIGLKKENVRISPECTYCNNNYFSFRRDKPTEITSQIAHISFIQKH
jgi:polyphenol oxidase